MKFNETVNTIPDILPHETMYQIQVGTKLFKISGASLSSDGPSFFTDYFQSGVDPDQQLTIDRSDTVFELIMEHLQGYPLSIANEEEFIMLFLDSLYFRLPKLSKMLHNYEYYFINVGGTHFKFSKNLFERPGDTPNYFNLLLDSMLIDLERLFKEKKMIRPPSHFVPFVTRSSILFQEILNLLTDDDYVVPANISIANLLKECKFYCLLNLQQRLLPHNITANPFCRREEITMNLHHLKRTGISLFGETLGFNACTQRDSDSDDSAYSPETKRKRMSPPADEWSMISYQRPFVDKTSRDLILQFDSSELTLYFNKRLKTIHVNILNQNDCNALKTLLIDVRKSKNIDLTQFEYPNFTGYIFFACVSMADLTINEIPCKNVCSKIDEIKTNEQIYDFKNGDGMMPGLTLHVIGPSLWRIGVKENCIMMIPLKLNCITNLKQFNKSLEFI